MLKPKSVNYNGIVSFIKANIKNILGCVSSVGNYEVNDSEVNILNYTPHSCDHRRNRR